MRLESLEIRDLLAANTLDFVDNLEIGAPGDTRDLQLEVDPASGNAIVALRISGTSGNLNPDVPLIFIQDTDRTNSANHVPLMQAMADVDGTTDSYVLFEVHGGDNFTIQVGGAGSGGFVAEIMHFGSTDSDQMISEIEYQEAVVAELQARGAGNHNTAAYFQAVYGIDFTKSQYNAAFDANYNGVIEGFELGYIEATKGQPLCVLDLIGDNEAPVATAKVAVDTGISATDNITSDTDGTGDDSAIIGTISDFSKITKAVIKVDGQSTSLDLVAEPNINKLTVGDNQITFGLSIADLETLLGSSVVDTGSHTLTIETEDELGNTSITPFSLVFEFDTTAPVTPTDVDLDFASDTGISGTDNITNDTTPTISVTAEAGSRVTFSSNTAGVLGTVIANASGVATITPTIGLAEGNHSITATATDAAGNVSEISTALVITIDTVNPDAFTNLVLSNATTHPNLTDQSQATFTGTSEANAFVELLDLNSAVIASTTADASGNFSFSLSDNATLDFDINNFTFRATDAAGNQTSAVFVVYRNTAPSIDAGQIFSIEENSVVDTTIGNVSASGNDAGDVLSYAITGIDAGYEGAFKINASTGEIQVNDPTKLNYEDKTSFTVTIQVTDSYGDGAGGEGLVTTQTVTINLNDVNEAPTFDQDTYTFSVEENSAAATSVGTVTGSDVDADDTSLTYGISGGSGDGLFEIDSATGAITVASGAVLDFETTDSYTLDVTITDALDSGEVGSVNTVTKMITINLIDVNEDPEFVGEPISLSVAEDAGEDAVVGTISATDVDADDSMAGDLTFGLTTGGTGDGLFAIDPTTGEVTLTALGASTIDFETTTSYTLNVTVTDNLDGDGAGEVGSAVTKTTTVTINILDANEAPEFVGEPISFSLPEDAAVNDSVGTVAATDVDADDNTAGDLTYGISGGSGASYFAIDPVTGEITVSDNSVFDFEGTNTFTLNVTATDNLDGDGAGEVGSVKTTTTTVTINLTNVNELPAVPGDTLDLGLVRLALVDEVSEEGTTVKVLGLVDPEMQTLTYTDTSGNTFFHVDSDGNVVLDQAITLGDLTDGELEIVLSNVLVSDGMDSKTITVTFTVTENSPPEFTSPAPGTTVNIDENLPDDVVLDSGDPIDGTLVLTATDEEGDNPLVFSVAASTANPDAALAALFAIAEVNGNSTVVVADATNLNYNYVNSHGATNGTFTINLVVTDNLGGFTTQTLEITVADRNDTPTFTDPGTLSLDEYVAKDPSVSFGTEAGTVVFDASTAFADADLGDTLTYSLDAAVVTGTSTDISGAFTIDPTTGIITVLDPTLLNAEGIDPDSVTLTISANDGSGESNSTVSGDLNIDIDPQDELPIYVSPTDSFDVRYRFVDGADSDDLTELGNISSVLSATDPEGDTITYSQRTTGASGEEYFALGSDGTITSLKSVDFTEDEMTFELVFDYSDGELDSDGDLGFSSGFVLTIRVFKNPPATFDQANYDFSLDENTAAGSTVVQTVSATDPDDETVTYAIDDPSGTFAINATTGEITIADGAALNHETNPTITFTVTAIDEASNETHLLVTVTVNDLNEAPSITNATLEFGVSEDASNGAAVGTVTATDPDAGDTTLNYQITGGTGQGIFTIDANGNITVADDSQLDFETTSSYTLNVQVTDNGGPTPGSNQMSDSKTFTITIGDVNEAPVFTGAAFDLPVVDEHNLTSTEIGTAGDDFFTKIYTNDTYNFLGQFTDPEGDSLTLTIANKAAIEALDYVESIDFVGNDLHIVFVHYGVDQDRTPFTIQIEAQETTSGNLTADAPLNVGVSVTNQKAVDVKLIPVASPTASSQAFAGISENDLPTAIDRVSDEQTFTIEVWGTTLVGEDDVTPGYAWIEGFTAAGFALQFNTDLLTTTSDNVYVPLPISTEPEAAVQVNSTTGEISNFLAFFGLTDALPAGVDSRGYNGEYVRLGYVTFTVKEGVDTSGLSVNDLMTIDLDNSKYTEIVFNPSDLNDYTPPLAGPDVPRADHIETDLNNAQVSIDYSAIEIVDAVKFEISAGDSMASLLVGANGSTIDGNQVAAQFAGADTTSVSGSLFILLNGDAANPTSLEIIGSELIFADSGSYLPGAPTSEGGAVQTGTATGGNFGLTSSDGSATTVNTAIRETVLRFAGSSTINLTGNASSGGATFNSQGIDIGIGGGFADVHQKVVVGSSTFNNDQRVSLGGKMLGSNGAENSMLVGDGVGGFTLTLDLNRILLDEVLGVEDADIDFNLLLNATIVAEINGGANLSGTVFKQDNQPLEDGSGVFVTVNKSRTQLDANGQVTELPDNAQWASEWDTLWVEVWGNTGDALGVYGGSLDLGYNTDLYTATEIEYAPSMSLNQSGTIDAANGKIVGLGSESESTTLGKGAFVLLGRVKLESLTNNGIDVSLDDFHSESLGLTVENASLGLTGVGETEVAANVADVDVWGVAYDVNNDGSIGLSDFSLFVQAFGKSSLHSNDALVAALDFDNDGSVGLSDFSFFAKNFGKSKSSAANIVYPETFTQTWVGEKVELDGPDSIEDVFNEALTDWQEALGLENPIDVKLVVTDYGDAQLGEAQLLAVDENGMPSYGILTLDDDGAGLGWSSDLAGGPAQGQYDLYTVILHELGHLYGFMSYYSGFADNIVTDYNGDKIFMGTDFVATLDDYGFHLDETENPGDVMNDTLDPGVRKTISELDVKMLLTAYASASSDSVVTSGSAALHTEALHADLTTDMIVSDAPASIVTETPLSFAYNKVVDVETVSGRTGYESLIAPSVFNELVRNGIRVTTSSSSEVQQQMDDIDSAVAAFAGDDTALLVADSIDDVRSFSTEDDSTNVDDLFADWDIDSDLEG
ncbi:cadherin domain-containing protein [Blastopirellula marina]|nr:cadherin domain-containing protein [Blastopirellula marina]